jgi:hypothetical protein
MTFAKGSEEGGAFSLSLFKHCKNQENPVSLDDPGEGVNIV